MWNKKAKPFYSPEEVERILAAVKSNEALTSGEIRICIETSCSYVNPLDRAAELFFQLKMYNTEYRNAVLIYIAYGDKDFAIYCDKAIYEKTNHTFWNQECKGLAKAFHQGLKVEGLIQAVNDIGFKLKELFPAQSKPKNELPDEIVFGK